MVSSAVRLTIPSRNFLFRLDNPLIALVHAWWNLVDESFDVALSSKIFSKFFLIMSYIAWKGFYEWNFEWTPGFMLIVISPSVLLSAILQVYFVLCWLVDLCCYVIIYVNDFIDDVMIIHSW